MINSTTLPTHQAPGLSPTLDVDIAIIGAGIGGLAAAVAFLTQGRTVRVFEQAAKLGEVGGAIIMRGPSADLLDQWGALDEYTKSAVRVDQIEFRDNTGEFLGSMPMVGRPGEPQLTYGIHRADLHGLLLKRVPAENIALGTVFTKVIDHETHAELHFADGNVVRAGLVIGADGIRSRVREFVSPGLSPIYAGLVVCRGVVDVDELPEGLTNDRMRMWVKDNRTIMAIPMRAGTQFAVDTVVHSDEAPAELWTSTIEPDDLLAAYDDFDAHITDMVRANGGPLHAQGVHELEPFDIWATDRVIVIGDAAHAMNPTHGQGANSAIQDAGILADYLTDLSLPDFPAALKRFQAARVPVMHEVQRASRVRPKTPGL